jgi:hypothetical protein
MATVYTLALTDDEAAAIALNANGAWLTPLPTVDETTEADLAAAILRGRRSLVVRELARPDGTALGKAAQVLSAVGAGPCAAFMLVDADDKWVPSGLTVYLYGTSPDQVTMSHVVATTGVHYFRVEPPPNQWLALTELAEAVFADGFTQAQDGVKQPSAALLCVVGETGIRNVRVACGQATAVGDQAPMKFSTAAEAARWVVE